MAAWHTEEFFYGQSRWTVWGSKWSHNGYHDVLLGGGVVAGLLFTLYIWLGIRSVSEEPVSAGTPQLLLICFVLVAATQESFIIGSHFLLALLVACVAHRMTGELSSNSEKNPNQLAT
jgi:hypothetical protein